MQAYTSYIDFSRFTMAEKCDLISHRISQPIAIGNKRLLTTIYEQLVDEDPTTSAFALQFSKLYDELNQLLRLEELVLFQYIKLCQEKQQKVNLSTNSIEQYKKHQLQIQKLLLETRLSFLELTGMRIMQNLEAIIDHDLVQLDNRIKEWVFVMNHYVLHQVQNPIMTDN